MSGKIINVKSAVESSDVNGRMEEANERPVTSPKKCGILKLCRQNGWVVVTWIVCLTVLSLFTMSVFYEFIENNPVTIITFINKPENPDPVVVKVCPSVLLDQQKILSYNGTEINYKAYEFLYEAASGNNNFNDTSWVVISPMKDTFLVSSRIMKEFALDKEAFIVSCFLVGHYDDCFPALEWHLDPVQPCYGATIDVRGYGKSNSLSISLFFDPTRTLSRYTSRLGAYVTFSHPDDYMAPSDGVFVGPQEAAVVSASVIHKKQTKSFEKAACVKKESPDWYNFTGIPFLSDYQPEHCVSLCYAQSFYKRCNCSPHLGLNITNTECIEDENLRRCVLMAIRDFKTVVQRSKKCLSNCLTKCEHSSYELAVRKEPLLVPGEKMRLSLTLLVTQNYTNATLVHNLFRRIVQHPKPLEEAQRISENFAQVTFFLRNNQQETKFEVIPFLTFPTFVSNVGGLVGMWLGISAISLMQFLEKKLTSFCSTNKGTQKVKPGGV